MDFVNVDTIEDLLKLAQDQNEDFVSSGDLELDDKITPRVRKLLNKAITPYTTGSETGNKHFDGIPITEMMKALEEQGYTLLQEDFTPWEGWLTGEEGKATMQLGVKRKMEQRYEPVKNTMLVLSWYKVMPHKYEINAYIS